MKTQGYATGQFGKNHLGDRDEHLPTNHGFDEFFGNLYHLNAEEEPEGYFYPKDPSFKKKYGPRGVIHSWAANAARERQDRGYRPAQHRAHADRRRGIPRGGAGLHQKGRRRRAAVLLLVQYHAHARVHPPEEGVGRQDRQGPACATAWSSTTAMSASCSTSSTSWTSPRTPSSSTRPTTAPRSRCGRTAR